MRFHTHRTGVHTGETTSDALVLSYLKAHIKHAVAVALIDNHRLHIDPAHIVLRHHRCSDERAPMLEVHIGRLDEPHVAIDARTRIPTAVLLLRVVHANNHLIVALVQQLRHIAQEGAVSVVLRTRRRAIDNNLRIHIHPLKIERVTSVVAFRLQVQYLTVLSLSCGVIAPIIARRFINRGHTLNAPVVRKIHIHHRLSLSTELPISINQHTSLLRHD